MRLYEQQKNRIRQTTDADAWTLFLYILLRAVDRPARIRFFDVLPRQQDRRKNIGVPDVQHLRDLYADVFPDMLVPLSDIFACSDRAVRQRRADDKRLARRLHADEGAIRPVRASPVQHNSIQDTALDRERKVVFLVTLLLCIRCADQP